MKQSTSSQRAVILAPHGRDAAIAVAMLSEAAIKAESCPSLSRLVHELDTGAAVVVITEEALTTGDLTPLTSWLAKQEEWSDLPFVLLTKQGGGVERNPVARRYLKVLGNVAFAERPFHATTLVSLVEASLRGRRRQYEARARLEALGFSAALDENLNRAADAAGAMKAAAELLARRLDTSRCAYADVDHTNDRFVIRNDYTAPGVASSVGTYSLNLFGHTAADELRNGRTLVVTDIAEQLSPRDGREMFLSIGIGAIVCCPLIKGGRLVAMMAVHQDRARNWQTSEIEIVETVVERCWSHVERVGAEARLRESETRYRTLFETMEAGFCIIEIIEDSEGRAIDYRYIEVNPAFERQSGLTGAAGRRVRELVPDLEDRWFQLFAEVGRTGQAVRTEGEVASLGRWFDVNAFRVGSPTERRVALHFTDISARRRKDAQLRRSESRFRAAVGAMQGILWTNNAAGEMFGEQPGWQSLTGQPYQDYQGHGWSNAVHPDDVQSTIDAWTEAVATRNNFAIEHRVRRFDGAWRLFAVQANPIVNDAGQIDEWVGVHTDVTEQRLAQGRLQEINELLKQRVSEGTVERNMLATIVETTDTSIQALDLDFRWLAINAACLAAYERVYGISPKVGDCLLDLMSDSGDRAKAEALWSRALAGEAFTMVDEFGDVVWGRRAFELKFETLFRPDGTRIGAFLTAVDVSERLEQQARLAEAEEALRQAQKMEAVGQLTGGVAHDFNNLLTIIKSSTDLLKRPGINEERKRRYINAIADTVDRAAKLTGQLLAFARRQPLKPEVFDTVERIRSVTEMITTVMGSRIAVVTELPSAGCYVEADVNQFETALVNMAVNARDAMSAEGTLTVRVERLNELPPIRGQPTKSGPHVAISIIDTGTGIPAEDQARIFEPFFTTKDVGKGTGLGLSQAYGFAKQSGGDIAVQSVFGCGSTFTLYLPEAERIAAPVEQLAAEKPRAVNKGQGRRVLVVEDNEGVGAFSTQLLQDLGYETTWAANAEIALKLLDEISGFDVVFSDVVMPGMSGIELGREVRLRYPGLPVVLTSGYSDVLAQEGRHGFELIQKPYAAEELSRVLRRVAG